MGENRSLGFPSRSDSNLSHSLTKMLKAWKLEVLNLTKGDTVLSV